MKKAFAVIAVVLMTMVVLAGCDFRGYDWIDTNYSFNKALIKMPDGSVQTVEIEKWADASDGEQLTITAKDGTIYLVHATNCILVKEGA